MSFTVCGAVVVVVLPLAAVPMLYACIPLALLLCLFKRVGIVGRKGRPTTRTKDELNVGGSQHVFLAPNAHDRTCGGCVVDRHHPNAAAFLMGGLVEPFGNNGHDRVDGRCCWLFVVVVVFVRVLETFPDGGLFCKKAAFCFAEFRENLVHIGVFCWDRGGGGSSSSSVGDCGAFVLSMLGKACQYRSWQVFAIAFVVEELKGIALFFLLQLPNGIVGLHRLEECDNTLDHLFTSQVLVDGGEATAEGSLLHRNIHVAFLGGIGQIFGH